jgi:hypothetical protein
MMPTSMLQMLNLRSPYDYGQGTGAVGQRINAADVRASRSGLRCNFGIDRLARVCGPMSCVRISHQGHRPRADQTGRIHISDFCYPEIEMVEEWRLRRSAEKNLAQMRMHAASGHRWDVTRGQWVA